MTTITVLTGSDVWRIHGNTTQSDGTAVQHTTRFDSSDVTTESVQANAIQAEHYLAIIYMTIGKAVYFFALSNCVFHFSTQLRNFE